MEGLGVNVRRVLLLLLAFAACFAIVACSGSDSGEEKAAESGIDKMTTEAAQVVVDKVRSPLDAARMTNSLGDKRLEEMDERLHGE